VKKTHVYPRLPDPVAKELFGAPQQHVGDDDINEVWDDLRSATLMGDAVLFPETHQYAEDEFFTEMEKARFDRALVKVLSLDPVTKTIHIPEQGPYRSQFVKHCSLGGDHKAHECNERVFGVKEVAETPATAKEIVVERFLNCGELRDARLIASHLTGNIHVVVIWEPCEEAGDLDYLSELPDDVHVVIFHNTLATSTVW
jgi:hypothetical protein